MITSTWDEPQRATTPRGWYWPPGTTKPGETSCAGHYLDYGQDHRRFDDRQADQPGKIHCVVIHAATRAAVESRYVDTICQARQYIEDAARQYGHP